MKPIKKKTSRIERKASESEYLKREGKLEDKVSRLVKADKTKKAKKAVGKFINKEMNILDKKDNQFKRRSNRAYRKADRAINRANRGS